MKKIIRLNEEDLKYLVKRVLKEQVEQDTDVISWNNYPLIKDQIRTIKPDPGGKYCFNQKMIDEIGKMFNYQVYKIKRGDTLDKIASMGNGLDSLKFTNNLCDLRKTFRAGDVIIIDMSPSGRIR